MTDDIMENWAIPPEDRIEEKNGRKLILECIKQKGITYPAEITMITGLSRQSVFDYLAKLSYSGEIKRLDIATCRNPPRALKRRLPELWAMGLKGNALKRMSWYRLSCDEDLDEPEPEIDNPIVKLDSQYPKNKPITDIDKAMEQITKNAKILKKDGVKTSK